MLLLTCSLTNSTSEVENPSSAVKSSEKLFSPFHGWWLSKFLRLFLALFGSKWWQAAASSRQ